MTVFFVISGFLITRSVDAELDRTGTLSYGGYVLKRLRRLVPPTPVIIACAALGSNDAGTGSEQEFENAVNAVNGKPLYFITIRNPAMDQDSINAAMRAVAAKHKNVGIMDWYGLSEGHSEYFYDDGVHLTIGDGLGRDAYSHMIIQAMCGQ